MLGGQPELLGAGNMLYDIWSLLQVRALRPIKNGEEVTVSYIDEALPLHERRQMLQAVRPKVQGRRFL